VGCSVVIKSGRLNSSIIALVMALVALVGRFRHPFERFRSHLPDHVLGGMWTGQCGIPFLYRSADHRRGT
jgi:hypothetical protein